jgi:predicted small lipoprotein YifL
MSSRMRALILGTLLAAAAAGCGQQGPLLLPEDARPVERVEQPAEASDDEEQDER